MKAKRQNSLVCLGTGAGKTYIAIMLISHLSHELEPPYDENGKRTFFLVPTQTLVKQQAAEIVRKSRFSESEVGDYTGAMNVDRWSKEMWLEHLRTKKIFVMTRQIFMNMLDTAAIPLRKVNLLIFDEAHHAAPNANKKNKKKNKDCYKLIMDHIHSRPVSEHPHILGLSASLINANNTVITLKQTIAELERIYKSTCTSVTDLEEVRKFATDPEECIWEYEEGTVAFECSQIAELLGKMYTIFCDMEEYKKAIQNKNKKRQAEENIELTTDMIVVDLPIGVDSFKKCHKIIREILQSMGPWCAIEACDFYIEEFQNYISLYENSYPAFCEILLTVNDMLCTVNGLIKYNFHLNQVSFGDIIFKFTSNKMKRLLELLMTYNNQSGSNQLAGIIFVQRRAICKTLCKWLQKVKEMDDNYEFLSTDYVVGEAARPGFANKIAVKAAQMQKETLNQFRQCKINLVVATSVLEEGLDVAQCNLVVRYDGVSTYREWVQSQGRARSKNGRFVIFSESKDQPTTTGNLTIFKELAKNLQMECQNTKKTYEPSSGVMEIIPEDEKPLIDHISGARVTMDTAKARVFMYCSRLPSDAFFATSPLEDIKESSDGFQCTIRLPINSPFKQEIVGPLKQTELKACKSAYLNICRILREHDEIDEFFVPYSKKERIKKIIEDFNLSCSLGDEEHSESGPKPGTVKRRQVYVKALEKQFANLPIKESSSNFLYSINVEPRTGIQHIGFICSELVPIIVSSFSVYIKSAEFKISVTPIDTKFNLSAHQLHQVQQFHQVVFHESLGFKRHQLKFDEKSPIYVVPLNNRSSVDWDMIQLTLNRNNFNNSRKHNIEERSEFLFQKADYDDALVYRCYNKFGLFEVLKVLDSQTAYSPFPNNEHGNIHYMDYYLEKYGLKIINTTYPLLSVDSVGFSSTLKRSEQTKAERKRTPINLVPEFLSIFPLPASFHRQCRLLPSIFYRLYQLHNVEKLRERIAIEANIGWKSVPSNHNWGVLKFDCAKSNCQDTYDKDECLVDSGSDSDHSDDYEPPKVRDKKDVGDTKMDCESSISVSSTHHSQEVVPSTFNTKIQNIQPVQETRKVTISTLYSDVQDDSDIIDLKNKFSDFSVDAYICSMKAKLLEDYEELLKTPLLTCDLGSHSQYLIRNPETLKKTYKCFSRVKSFDDHKDTDTVTGPTPSLLLQALTTSNAMDMFNMERLETLGDSFLKLTTSAYFYYKLPVLNEGYLSLLKVNQISNYNLYRLGKEKDLANYMVAQQFRSISSWIPPGFCVVKENAVTEKQNEQTYNKFIEQKIGDKSIADCCEALIGAYLLSSGPIAAVKFMTWLGIRVSDPVTDDNVDHWLQPPKSGEATSSCINAEIKIQNLSSTLTGFEEYIGYNFRDKCLLIQAMTHVSYHDNTVTDCYQRLEFLGDAVLDYLVTRYIYEDPQQFKPGDLTDLRAALTNNSFFGSLAVKHNFHRHLKMNSYELYRSINSFADKFKTNPTDIVYGNFMQLIDEREVNTLEETEIPKALGDVFEAVAGAIYLDSKYSLDAVWRVYYPLMKIEFGESISAITKRTFNKFYLLYSDEFSKNIPKSPLSLLYIKFPMSVAFSKPKKVDKSQYSVTVTVKNKDCAFSELGSGKNLYWAKNSAAKRALKRQYRSDSLIN